MDKQKQINEIADIIFEALNNKGRIANGEGVDIISAAIYNAGYRKIDKNAVVLTEERNKIICDRFAQLERVQAELQELNAKYYNEAKDLRREVKKVRKETAEKFADRLKAMAYQSTDWSHGEHPMVVEVDYIDEICEEITDKGVQNGN